MTTNKHKGSSFDSFLEEEGLLESNASITLNTLSKVAHFLGKKLHISLR